MNNQGQPDKTGYYVIVGRGVAAIVNHTTLRQSKKGEERLGGLTVMHIGLPDPWLHYHKHNMGQPPYLLGMPGYHHPVPLNASENLTGCNSKDFADSTEAEWKELTQKFPNIKLTEGWVAAIESKTIRVSYILLRALIKDLGVAPADLFQVLTVPLAPNDPPYRLLVFDTKGKPFWVYAVKIDICNGPGVMRVPPLSSILIQPTSLHVAISRPPWELPSGWSPATKRRLIIHGMDGLNKQTQWNSGDRVCIYGGGGIGLNQVELAQAKGVSLDWLDKATLHKGFNLARNDHVLKDSTTPTGFMAVGGMDAMRLGHNVSDGRMTFDEKNYELIPGAQDWRFAKNSTLTNVNLTGLGKSAAVTIQTNVTAEIFDWWHPAGHPQQLNGQHYFSFSTGYAKTHSLPDDEFDRVIICIGQETRGLGTAQGITDNFIFNPITYEHRTIGLEADRGSIRILGAAATQFPHQPSPGQPPTPSQINMINGFSALVTYSLGLPESAILPGFIVSGVNIAAANGWFDAQPNNNVNTASQDELVAQLAGLPAGNTIAGMIVDLRQYPSNGFADAQALKAGLTAKGVGLQDIQHVMTKLTTKYRLADVW